MWLTYFLPTQVSVCTQSKLCLWMREVSLASCSFCPDSSWHLALQVKPSVQWSIHINKSPGETRCTRHTDVLFKNLFPALNLWLRCDYAHLNCKHPCALLIPVLLNDEIPVWIPGHRYPQPEKKRGTEAKQQQKKATTAWFPKHIPESAHRSRAQAAVSLTVLHRYKIKKRPWG